MYIAVDFDGTCVTDKWPEIGEAVPFCIETLKKFQVDGHKIILNTCREGRLLAEAIDWLSDKGVFLYAWNENPEAKEKWGECRKVYADLYIDDHNAFTRKRSDGTVDWLYISRKYDAMRSTQDAVDHPSHYQTGGELEAIDVLEAFNLHGELWNAMKYLMRNGKKAGEPATKDLKKARWYLTRYIENVENGGAE